MKGPTEFFVFPKWTNTIRPAVALTALVGPVWLILLVAYGASPQTTDVGYAPKQPVEYSHALHAGELGLDCRYCHWPVENGAKAAIPPTSVCMNCHQTIRTYSAKMAPVLDSHTSGMPIPWVRVHDLPDYVYFNHSAHINRGVACTTCHGRVYTMDVVRQVQPLSMSWCLDCHRQPEKYLQPLETLPDRTYVQPENQLEVGRRVREELNINPSTDCSACHR